MKYEFTDPIATTHELLQKTGGRSWMRDLFALSGAWDVDKWEDNFHGDALLSQYAVTTGVDGSHDKIAGALGGTSTLDVGDGGTSGDNEYGGLALGLEWAGDNNALFVCQIKISDITTVKVEIGFTDALADAGAALVLATPTATASDAALWVLDTDDTATWQCFGVKATALATKIEDGAIEAPVNGTYQTMIVRLQGDFAKFYQLNAANELVFESEWMTDAIEGGTLVTPWVFVQNRAAGIDRLVTLGKFNVYQSGSAT
jgi:hypothetical protein